MDPTTFLLVAAVAVLGVSVALGTRRRDDALVPIARAPRGSPAASAQPLQAPNPRVELLQERSDDGSEPSAHGHGAEDVLLGDDARIHQRS